MINKLLITADFSRKCLPTYFGFFSSRFKQVENVLKEKKSLDTPQDPTRIFSSDESGFQHYFRFSVLRGQKCV
jgi:hypothetical protein